MRLGYTGLSCQHLSRKLSIAKVQVIFRGFLKTLHEKPYFFFKMFSKNGLSKKVALEYYLSCIIRKDDISLSRKYDPILSAENER